MKKADSASVYELLNKLNIPFEHISHAPAVSMEDLTEAEHRLGSPFCKNLFLANRQQTEFYLLLIRGDKRFRTAEISKKLGVSRLSFGNEDRLYDLLGVRPGAITPMGLVFDERHEVQLLVDRDLLELTRMCVHPCVNTESLILRVQDLKDIFFPYTGHEPNYLEITGLVDGE